MKQTVVLVGSGRSGTTWLGSILDSYERAEYYFEITAFPFLDFDSPELLRLKYPLTFWWKSRPYWMSCIERRLLYARIRLNVGKRDAERSLRIHKYYEFKKNKPDINLFKEVTLLQFAMRTEELANRFGDNIKVIYVIRNPFAYAVSELRNQHKNLVWAKSYFSNIVSRVKMDPKLSDYHNLFELYENGDFVEHITLLWRISNELMLKDDKLPSHMVIYEKLCRNPYKEVKNIFGFLQWPMSDQTREHIERTTNISVSDPGTWSIYKNPLHSMERWRKEISTENYKKINRVLNNCMLLDLWNKEDLGDDLQPQFSK